MTESRGPWKRLGGVRTEVNPWFQYVLDEVELPDGARTTYAYQDHVDSVVVVPVTTDRQIVLLRQYRYAVDYWCYEVPAGGLNEDSPEAGARRELLEEAGGVCPSLELIGTFYGLPGSCNVRFFIFLAAGVVLGDNNPEATESLEVVSVPIGEAFRMVHAGLVTDGPSLVALLRCAPRLHELFPTAGAMGGKP